MEIGKGNWVRGGEERGEGDINKQGSRKIKFTIWKKNVAIITKLLDFFHTFGSNFWKNLLIFSNIFLNGFGFILLFKFCQYIFQKLLENFISIFFNLNFIIYFIICKFPNCASNWNNFFNNWKKKYFGFIFNFSKFWFKFFLEFYQHNLIFLNRSN